MEALSRCSVKFGNISLFFCRGLATHVEKLREAGQGLAALKEKPRHISGNVLVDEAEVAAPKAAG